MNYIERELERQIKNRLDSGKALFILGARQVGKTTLLKHLMEEVGRDNSLYYDIELPENLETFSGTVENILSRLRFDRLKETGRTYVFLDEIQYLKDFSQMIKIFTDHHAEEYKFVMTGSSSLMIKHQFRESLVGRKEIMILYPLSFAEFCLFRGEPKIAAKILENAITPNNPLWQITGKMESLIAEYTVYGGFPEVVAQPNSNLKTEILNEIVSAYIIKDIKHILQIEKTGEFNRLVRNMALSMGKELNVSELSRNVGLHHETTKKYIMTLEESFIISTIRPFYAQLDKELRKMPKVYMIDTGVRNMLLNDFSDLQTRMDKGELIENIFYMNLLRGKQVTTEIKYWRTKQGGEIDFVVKEGGQISAYEVKYGDDRSNHFRSFQNAYPQANCYIVRFKYQYKEGELPLWSSGYCERATQGAKGQEGKGGKE